MTSQREPLDWYIEICGVCGCQLGPGIGSRTRNGRCVVAEHGQVGGVIVRVVARPIAEQDVSAHRVLSRLARPTTSSSRDS